MKTLKPTIHQTLFTTFGLGAAAALLLWQGLPVFAGGGGTAVLSDAAYSVDETEGGIVITVQRLAGDDGAASVSYRTVDGTAVAGQDYTQTTGTIQWPDGDDDNRTFLIPILDDGIFERGEEFTVELFNPLGIALGTPSEAPVTILDDEVDEPGEPPDCAPDATTLCLQSDRFRVTSEWRRPNGETGVGMAVELTPDTGYFWFFNETNVEMIVKVLRGCPNNGHYWVFAGGLTNVEVDLTVEDTMTNQIATYRNTLLEPFQPIQDNMAFETCP